MKIKIDWQWIGAKIFYIIAAILCFHYGYFYIGIAAIIITIQFIAHEFIHGLAVKLTGGEIIEIGFPGTLNSYIDFQATSFKAERMIYQAGYSFEFTMTMIACLVLYYGTGVTGNNIYAIVGVILLIVFVIEGILPERSDFRRSAEYK